MRRLNVKEKLIYSAGQFGVGLITATHILHLVYYFFPPEDAGIAWVIPQKTMIFGLTIIGIALALGRIVDAFTDPWIAGLSDRSKNPKGRRIPFMRKFAFLFAASTIGVFFVPMTGQIHVMNSVWLIVMLALSALFLTLYTIPYITFMVDYAPHPDDKVDIGTFGSLFWFMGLAIVSFAPSLWEYLEGNWGMSRDASMRIGFVIVGVIGFMALLIPAYLIDERKYSSHIESTQFVSIRQSLKKVLSNKNFVCFLISNSGYSIATYMYEAGLIYFITVLALMKASVQGPITIAVAVLILPVYPLVNWISKKYGKKIVMIIGFVLFAVNLLILSIMGLGDIPTIVIMGIVVFLSPFSQAVFQVLPSVMTADCASYAKFQTGEDNAAMYSAVNGFFTKLSTSIATILFTGLLLLGKDVGDDSGIRLVAISGAIISVLCVFIVRRYNEKEIMRYSKGGEIDESGKLS